MSHKGVAVHHRRAPGFRTALLIIALAALVAGCTITIEGGGHGHLVMHMLHIPENVTRISYVARSDAGLGHYRGGSIHGVRETKTYDFGEVAAGVWTVEIQGKDAAGRNVYSHKETVSVTRDRRTVVTFWDWRLVEQSSHGTFIAHNISGRPLQNHIDDYERFIVPDLQATTGLRPAENKPVIHVYGLERAWLEHAPCRLENSCYDASLEAIHVRADERSGVDVKAFTEAYARWLFRGEGDARPPHWFEAGLARLEAERVYRGDDDWSNPWLRRQWDEIRLSTAVVPYLAMHERSDAFTFTAVAHLLETRGGAIALREFFRYTRRGYSFSVALHEAFGVTTLDFQDEYEAVVKRERGSVRRR